MPALTPLKAIKPSSAPRAQSLKKTRFVRRRGRANDGIYSDEEFVREARSDTESDDDRSSLDSASDSETEPVSEDAPPTGHPQVVIPSSTHTPQPPEVSAVKPLVKSASAGPTLLNAPLDWADDSVADDHDLPVIDFADLDAQHRFQSTRSRKPERGGKRPVLARTSSAPPTTLSPAPNSEHSEERPGSPVPSTSEPRQREASFTRRVGQTARQAYQERLESDPSYVPTVGEFWGHDDRLLDKDLRSLSGWWRGKWQGRGGRGRGRFNNGFGARGRGGFMNSRSVAPEDEGEQEGSADVPPVERPWTHDGFEEMKKRDERRAEFQQQQPQRGFMRGGFRGGRGGFTPRGRGFARGGFSPVSTHARQGMPSSSSPHRVWYAMKPERVWTKHHESFLYSDPSLKPRVGQGAGYRIKLPGQPQEEIVRTPPRPWASPSSPTSALAAPSATASEAADKVFTVRLPPREETAVPEMPEPEPATTVAEPPIDDAFVITKPPPPTVIPIPAPPTPQPSTSSSPALGPQPAQVPAEPASSDSDGEWIEAPTIPPTSHDRPQPPILPPLQTVFSPMAQPSPSFGSPYGYAPALPPGIGLNQHGIPYEIATGRAVYLQPPPPPPGPLYNPRGVIPGHMSMPPGLPFVPHHVHHHSNLSVSPDFLAHSPAPSAYTGEAPMFAPPRQSSRIEIRKPTPEDEANAKKGPSPRPALRNGASSLRSSVTSSSASAAGVPRSVDPNAPAFIPPSHMQRPSQEYFPNGSPSPAYPMASAEDHRPPPPMDPGMMGYQPYQQGYYYPETYGYQPYVDMPQQGMPYEVYPPDPRTSQPVYY